MEKLQRLGQTLAQASTPHAGALGNLLSLTVGSPPTSEDLEKDPNAKSGAAKFLDKLSYGERVTSGSGETLHVDPEALDVAGLIPSPAKAAAAVKGVAGALAAKLPMAAAIGAIRKAGDPELFLHHGTNSYDGIKTAVEKGGLLSPSLAVTRGPLYNSFSGDGGVTLLAKEGAFDPAYSPSTMFNRDAYVPRMSGYRSRFREYDTRADARNRLDDRFLGPRDEFLTPGMDIKFGEGPSYPGSLGIGHQMAIAESPIFRSFAQYERDPAGAAILSSSMSPVSAARDLEGVVETWFESRGTDMPKLWSDAKQTLVYFAERGDEVARQILQMARRVPSNYAELKVHGRVPITNEHWAGAIAGPNVDEYALDQYDKIFQRGRIPFVQVDSSDKAQQFAQQMQEIAGGFGRTSLSSDVARSRPAKIDPNAWDDAFNKIPSVGTQPPASVVQGLPSGLHTVSNDPSMWGIAPEIEQLIKDTVPKIDAVEEGKKLKSMNIPGEVIVDMFEGATLKNMPQVQFIPHLFEVLDEGEPLSFNSLDHALGSKYVSKFAEEMELKYGKNTMTKDLTAEQQKELLNKILKVPSKVAMNPPDMLKKLLLEDLNKTFKEVDFTNAPKHVLLAFDEMLKADHGLTIGKLVDFGFNSGELEDIFLTAKTMYGFDTNFSSLDWTNKTKVMLEWAKKNVP